MGGGALAVPVLYMSNAYDDLAEEPASAVSANLTEQMLHLTNRFEEERLKLEERSFQTDADDPRGGDDS
jgi:hypothetical protein